jgi:hypothetical protein
MITPLLVPLALLACQGDKITLGGGSPPDARLYADLYTWECQDSDTGGVVDEWEGVFAYDVALEYAPDNLPSRSVPESGCTKGLDLFPSSAGSGGHDVGSGTPSWANGDESGNINKRSTGFYFTNVFGNRNGCEYPDDILGDGTAISNAGSFSGAKTPAPGTYNDVTVSADLGDDGLDFGTEATVTWDADGWDRSWVQIRRENGGVLSESVTCSTTGMTSYTIGDEAWSLFNSAVTAEVTNLYVAVEKSSESETEDGQKIETITRAMHVGVVQD